MAPEAGRDNGNTRHCVSGRVASEKGPLTKRRLEAIDGRPWENARRGNRKMAGGSSSIDDDFRGKFIISSQDVEVWSNLIVEDVLR